MLEMKGNKNANSPKKPIDEMCLFGEFVIHGLVSKRQTHIS